jgi:hypothetical protein
MGQTKTLITNKYTGNPKTKTLNFKTDAQAYKFKTKEQLSDCGQI